MASFLRSKAYLASILAVIVVIMTIVLTSYILAVQNENDRIEQLFKSTSTSAKNIILERINSLLGHYENVAISFGTHGSFINITKSIFDSLSKSDPALFTISYNPIVNDTDRTLFESHFSEQLGKNISIRFSLPNRSTIISITKDFYVPIGYTNFESPAHGIDLYPIPDRKPVIDSAINNGIGATSDLGLFLTPDASINIVLSVVPITDLSGNINAILGYVLFVENFFEKIITESVNNLNLNGHVIYQDTLLYSSLPEYNNGDNYQTIIDNSKFINKFDTHIFDKTFSYLITDKLEFDNNIVSNDNIITLIIGILLLLIIIVLITYLFYLNQKNEKEIYLTSKLSTEKAYQRVLSYICHEIRNPLNIIYSLLYYLQMPNNNNKIDINDIKEINTETEVNLTIKPNEMSTLIDTTQRIKSIVDEVLSVQKLIEGKVNISYQKIDVVEFIKEIVAQNSLNINKDTKCILYVNQTLLDNPIIYTDTIRLTQIILNGITNAIKFTANGEIIIRLVKLNLENQYLSLEILNTGIGLKGLNIKQLFIPFGQGMSNGAMKYEKEKPDTFLDEKNEISEDKSRLLNHMKKAKNMNLISIQEINGQIIGKSKLSEQKGSGLGLPIAKMLSIRLGGYLVLEDDDKYTRFQFIINCDKPKDINNIYDDNITINVESNKIGPNDNMEMTEFNNSKYHKDIKPKDISILIVDDTPINMRTGKLVFSKLGYNVEIVDDGIHIDYDTINNYDIILLDIIMKYSSGLDICNKLQRKGYKGIILATTGNLTNEDIKIYHKYNFNGVYGKPFIYTKCHEFFIKLLMTREWDILY